MSTITVGAVTITPLLVTGYESAREAGNIVHPILGRPTPTVTYRPAGTRTGHMELLFADEADAVAAEEALAGSTVCTFTSSAAPTAAMTFVLDEGSQLTRTLDPQTRQRWLVAFDWREVTP